MTYRGEWESGFVEYSPGDTVNYNGKTYRVIQGHRSQGDWLPSSVPALYSQVPGGGQQHQECHQPHQPPQHQPQGGGYNQGQGQSHHQQPSHDHDHDHKKPMVPAGGYKTDNNVEVKQEEAEKKWYELDDDKKGLLIGGGLAAGLGLLAGGAYYAHEKHKKEGEDEKAQAWEVQNWMTAAQRRTDTFSQHGQQKPTTWVLSGALEGNDNLRENLVRGGSEDGRPWFVARAPHSGGLQVGKCRPGFGAYIGFKGDAILVKQYEVLVAQQSGIRWVRTSGKLNEDSLGARPVEAGHEDDGTPLAVARATYKGVQHCGKASPKLKGAYVCVGDDEEHVDEYEVLCYA